MHISQLDSERVEKVEDVVYVGDEITVMVTEIDDTARFASPARQSWKAGPPKKPWLTIDHLVGAPVARGVGGGVIGVAHPIMRATGSRIDVIDVNNDLEPVFQLKTGHYFFYAKIKVMSAKFSTTDYRYRLSISFW